MSDEKKEPLQEYDSILTQILKESAHKEAKWIIRGIVGFSIFCVCLAVIGVISIIKLLFA